MAHIAASTRKHSSPIVTVRPDGTITNAVHKDLLACRQAVYTALASAQNERHLRVESWQEHERGVVTDTASKWAQSHGYPQPSPSQIAQAEQLACGHCDYTSKYALYVAQAVVIHR